MRLPPPTTARIVWEEGMHLAPHHFQAQRRHADEQLARTLDLLQPFAYGVVAAELDDSALRNGTLALVHARGILPDGTPFHLPDGDPLPPTSVLRDRFSPTRESHVVHLALPRLRQDAPLVAAPADTSGAASARPVNGAPRPRYLRVERSLIDETSGDDATPVAFAERAFTLLLDEEVGADDVTLPIARVRRDGANAFVADPAFVPPALQIGASARLLDLAVRVADMLAAKGSALVASLASAGDDSASAYVGNELATRWLLHAVRSAEAPLRHLAATPAVHPERLWLELVRLAGSLCTFALDATPRDLPLYTHDEPEACFGALDRFLRTHLDVVVTSQAITMPLRKVDDVLHATPVGDARCFEPGARWFLAVRSTLPVPEVAARTPRLVKACATKFVMELVRRAFDGLAMTHVAAPPPAIAPRADRAYFELVREGPCAEALYKAREFGVYVPDGLPDASLQLVVLVPTR